MGPGGAIGLTTRLQMLVPSACLAIIQGGVFQFALAGGQTGIRVAVLCFGIVAHDCSSSMSRSLSPEGERGRLDVSSARLNALLRLHLRPIDVVVFHAPHWENSSWEGLGA